jgi:hypothetical protein
MLRPLIAIAALAGCATAAEPTAAPVPDEKLEAALVGRTAGKPVSCVSLSRAQSSTTYRDAIVYREGNTLYVNRVGACPGLRSDPILITRNFGGQICRGEPIELADRNTGTFRGTCILGNFEPYKRLR